MDQLKVIELYSGIGGMHYAIKMANLNANIVAAVDINPNANLVYKHNFKASKVLQKTIEGIKLEEYNKLDFDMIVMSPPCQPFTRQGNQNGANDARAQSFLNLIDLIPKLQKKPKYILMENVKGFDEDQARVDFIKMLKSQNYYYQEFLLSPIQFGIPNSRLRYFLIARYNEPFDFESTGNIINTLPSKVKPWINEMINSLNFSENLNNLSSEETAVPNNLTAHIKRSQINEDYKNCSQSVSEQILVDQVKTLRDFVSNQIGHQKDLFLNDEMFLKSINLMDLVSENSTRTSCFTKNYGRYLEGTGSILRVVDSENPKLEEAESIEIRQDSIRFFSPKEIANLHCFPNEFSFPKELTTLQKFKLIGNSLNVLIVAVLLRLLTS